MNTRLVEQRRLITVWILRLSIGFSVLSIFTGLTVFVLKGGNYFPRSPSGSVGTIFAYVWDEVRTLHAGAFLDAGVLVALFTPLARLASGVIANLRARDWLYVGIGTVVIGLVLAGLVTGQAAG